MPNVHALRMPRPDGPSDAAISPVVLVKGAGEMASAVAWRLYMANIRRVCMLDLAQPLCVRRRVSFCTALEAGTAEVEGVRAVRARSRGEVETAWESGTIAVVCTDDWARIAGVQPEVVIDAILAKRNTGTRKADAPLVIALGPGFDAGRDCHRRRDQSGAQPRAAHRPRQCRAEHRRAGRDRGVRRRARAPGAGFRRVRVDARDRGSGAQG
jgi:hypothetical protein